MARKSPDTIRAEKIEHEFGEIMELRRRIDTKFKVIAKLMEEDNQPDYALKQIEDLRITHKVSLHMELVHVWSAWAGYASARKELL